MSLSIVVASAIAFLVTFAITPKFIAFNERIGLVGTDVQKRNRPQIAESGGAPVLAGVLTGSFAFIWLKVFVYGGMPGLSEVLAATATILIAAFIGLFDDLSFLLKRIDGRTGFKRIGLPQWAKPLLTLGAAMPLMAIMAGETTMTLPLYGITDLGIIYPLILVPLAVVGATNATNMLAGLNGLEAGLGTVILSSMGLFSLATGQLAAAAIALPLAGALLGFLVWNWWPAKIMPGDSLPYIMGAAIATVAVVGNMERFAILSFTPWFLEFFLKARGRLKSEGFGMIQGDGSLAPPYKKSYSLTHVVMRIGHLNERQIVTVLILVEILVSAFAWVLYWPF